MNAIKSILCPQQQSTYYMGPDLAEGPLPAFFYFSLSGEESLQLHPYNQPPQLLSDASLRIFSFTLPSHGGNFNKFHAMQHWAERMESGETFLEDFFDQIAQSIEWLIQQGWIDQKNMATGGLSRGGFIATHIAARVPDISTILAFAPLTELMKLKEFSEIPSLMHHASMLDLIHLADRLTHIQHLRFYIGTLDQRVDTDACYRFIRLLAEKGHEKRLRSQKIELILTSPIGHKGHGTDPEIFKQGTAWLKSVLNKRL